MERPIKEDEAAAPRRSDQEPYRSEQEQYNSDRGAKMDKRAAARKAALAEALELNKGQAAQLAHQAGDHTAPLAVLLLERRKTKNLLKNDVQRLADNS